MALDTVDHWEYSKWVVAVGRSLRINPAVNPSAELTAAEDFVNDMQAKRPWLDDDIDNNSIAEQSATLLDNPQVLGRNIELIGRDILKISVQDVTEKGYVDALIAATGNRRFGAQSGAGAGISDVVK
jgi:hypothetical protein